MCVLQLCFPHHLLLAAVLKWTTDEVNLWNEPKEPSMYFYRMFQEPKEISNEHP